MARLTVLRFTKDYETVADAMSGMVKEAKVTRREEHERVFIDVEGQFSHFVLEDMEVWEPYLKFEIQDNAIKDQEDRAARSILASAEPSLSSVLFSPTIAQVYRRVEHIIRTTTITERIEGGKSVKRDEQTSDSDPQYDWVEVTREFGQKVRIEW